jgi:hypothetical protein
MADPLFGGTRTMTTRRIRRIALAALASGTLAGCAALLDPQGFGETAVSSMPFSEPSTDKAMSALTRGDYPNAERYAIAALRRNPKDPYALITAGMTYQATGRYDLARQYYEVIVSNQPQASITVPGPGTPVPRSVVDVARTNMAAIDKITGRSAQRTAAQSGMGLTGEMPTRADPMSPTAAMRPPVSAEPNNDAAASAMAVPGRPTSAETNVAGRFRILKRLLDEGLITQDEYASRRNSNLGVLLPYSTAVPPAQGLERSLPGDGQVVDRLRALANALESRAITPRELASERTAILDALLPAQPAKVELPALPPKDVIEAAAAVGRLERMRAVGLVGPDEVARERDAIQRAFDGQTASLPVSGTATGLRQGRAAAGGAGGVPAAAGFGVNLATVKSEAAARSTWAGIKQKFPEQLGAVEADFRKVDLGEKGVRWRVIAGPLASQDAARKLCKVLKLHRQACQPTGFAKG